MRKLDVGHAIEMKLFYMYTAEKKAYMIYRNACQDEVYINSFSSVPKLVEGDNEGDLIDDND